MTEGAIDIYENDLLNELNKAKFHKYKAQTSILNHSDYPSGYLLAFNNHHGDHPDNPDDSFEC